MLIPFLSATTEAQYKFAQTLSQPAIIGSDFERTPESATPRYVSWHNSLINEEDLHLQQFRETTLAHPTWFMHREVWEIVGGYDERYPSIPEDMIFFYKWMQHKGNIHKICQPLTIYRWHEGATSFSIHRHILLKEKINHLNIMVLSKVDSFTIWGNGRDGKKFFMSLPQEAKDKVIAFCDVDEKKIGSFYMDHSCKRKIPIIHFSKAKPLVIICVALNRVLGGGPLGEFEKNLQSMNWEEGEHYWHVV